MNTQRMEIPKAEYEQRMRRIQDEMRKEQIDVLIAYACECESANVRYLSNFWAVFDFAGVVVPQSGPPMLLTGGPESYDFARQFSKIEDIRVHPLYVETSAPEWDKPTNAYDFGEIFREIEQNFSIKKIGIANNNILPHVIFNDIDKAAPNATYVNADDILMKARWYKSDNEIKLLKEAYRITEEGIKQIFDMIKPGVSEWEIEALWRSAAYKMGAEGTSYPIWVTSGEKTYQSLCRSTDRIIGKDEMVQLTFGAKYNGYCGNMCRPVIIGKLPDKHEKMIRIALECLEETLDVMKPGVPFADVYDRFQAPACEERLFRYESVWACTWNGHAGMRGTMGG